MKKSRFTEENIIEILKLHAAGGKAGELCRQYGISEATLYTCKAKYGAMTVSEARRINGFSVIETFADTMLRHDIPAYIRSDNGPARRLRPKSCAPGSPKSARRRCSSSPAARGRTAASEAHAREAERLAVGVLPLVRPTPSLRCGRPGRPLIRTGADLEPGVGYRPGLGDRPGPRTP